MEQSLQLEIGDGLSMAYSIAGKATRIGRTAMLLHGFMGSRATWQRIVPDLSTSWRFVLPDMLGHGGSSAPANVASYRMEAAAEYLAMLLAVSAGEPVHMLGYSMGGRLALYFALAFPQLVRSLVLESASPGLETVPERTARRASDEALADRILSEGIEAFVHRWEALPLFASQANLPREVLQDQRQQRLANAPVGLAGSLRGMGTGVQPSLWGRLGELSCPVLLIVGEYDAKFQAINQRMQECIHNAKLVVIPCAGHTTHLEQPESFIRQVRAFWERFSPDTDPPRP